MERLSGRARKALLNFKGDQPKEPIRAMLQAFGEVTYTEVGAIHFNGAQKILTFRLVDENDHCVECGKLKSLEWHQRTGVVRLRCKTPSCPYTEYNISFRDDLALNHAEGAKVCDIDACRREDPDGDSISRKRTLDMLRTNRPKIEVARNKGMLLADLIQEEHHGSHAGIHPVDAFDGKHWWFYDEDHHIWKVDKGCGAHIHRTIIKTIKDIYTREAEELELSMNDHRNELAEGRKVIAELLQYCNQSVTRLNIIADCRVAFQDLSFAHKLNQCPDIIGMTNGVFDFLENRLRAGRPSDMITMSTGREFIPLPLPPPPGGLPRMLQLMPNISQFLRDILIEDQMVEAVLKVLCFSLRSKALQRFFIFSGRGANGKSILQKLFTKVMGSYSVVLPVGAVTNKRVENGRANPEMCRTKDCRLVFLSEPDNNETLNAGAIKEMTGGDSMFVRGLYSDGGEQVCKFTPILSCNDRPNVIDTSEGMWRRLTPIDFPVQFKVHPDPSKHPYERQLNDDVDHGFRDELDIFTSWCLTEGLQLAEGTGWRDPVSVLASAEAMRQANDWIAQFKADFLVHTNNPSDAVQWKDVLSSATNYWKTHHEGKVPKTMDVRSGFEKTMGQKLKKSCWVGWLMPHPCTSAY